MSRMSELSTSTAAIFFSQYDIWYVFYMYIVCKTATFILQDSGQNFHSKILFLFALFLLQQHITSLQ